MKKIIYLLIVLVAFAIPFTSCSDDDKDKIEPPVEIEEGVYILNRGNYNANNASIGYYSFTTEEYISDLYKSVNGSSLGESAESMLIYGSKIYVAVTFSNRLAVLDLDGSLIETIEPKDSDGSPLNPRHLAATNGKVYVSYYYGHSVAVIDTLTLKEEKVIPVGRYPEGLTIANNELYVANSGGGDFPDYGNTVSVIDLSSLSVVDEITVLPNPNILASDSQGDVYVISYGDHGETQDHTLQRINTKTGEITALGQASKMSLVNDVIYVMFNQYYGNAGIKFISYDAKTETILDESLIKDGTTITSPVSINVDPVSGDIYISDYDYSSTSTMYIFNSKGIKEKSFDTGGYDTQGVYFLQKK